MSRNLLSRTSCVIALLTAFGSAKNAAQGGHLTEYQVRQIARVAVTEANGDYMAFREPFVREVKAAAPGYTGQLVPALCVTDSIEVSLVGPVEGFAAAVREAVRRMEPADQLPWPPGIAIYVSPYQIDAPDIDKVVVTRNGTIVPPLSSSLRLINMTSKTGATFSIHSGRIMYPISAFDPGAEVVVTAIPVAGDNCRRVFRDADLRQIF